MRVIQVMDGVPISERAQCRGLRGSRKRNALREHSAEIWCVV